MGINGSRSSSALHRYSAKRMQKPVNFFCDVSEAKQAASVSLVGITQVALPHGHHCYQFLVDGEPVLDPQAQGIARNARNQRVSMISVS